MVPSPSGADGGDANRGLIEAVRVVVDGMSRLNAMRGPDAPPPRAVSAPVSGRYTSSHMDAPLAGHEESVGVRCNALKASPGNG